MPTVTVTLHTAEFERVVKALKGSAVQAAVARAVTRATASIKTLMSREVAKDLGIKKSDADKGITSQILRDENRSVQSGRIIARGARIPLIAFSAKGPEPSFGRGRGVTAKLGGARKQYARAFIATMPTGHRGVFMRAKPPLRLPIRELFGPSITHVFEKFIPLGMARGEEQLTKNVTHEIEFALSKLPRTA